MCGDEPGDACRHAGSARAGRGGPGRDPVRDLSADETPRACCCWPGPARSPVNRPWVRWALAELDRRPLRLPRVVAADRDRPAVLAGIPFPAPAGREPRPRRGTGPAARDTGRVRSGLACAACSAIRPVAGQRDRACSSGRGESLAEIAAEVADYHDRLIAPHWERMRSVLEADISYHAELLADGGARSLFSELHPGLRWSQGKLTDDRRGDRAAGVPRSRSGQTAWCWCRACSTGRTGRSRRRRAPRPRCCTRRGAPRRCGRAPKRPRPARAAVELLLGAPRARLLGALRSPATTSALARRFGVTPSAVSQHLAVLHRGGLVDRQPQRADGAVPGL